MTDSVSAPQSEFRSRQMTPIPSARVVAPGWRQAATAVSVTLLLLLAGTASCVERDKPKQTVDSLIKASRTLRENGLKIQIGVRGDLPRVSYRNEATGEYSGFEIDIAKALAAELGYGEEQIEWILLDSVPERLEVLQTGQADMVVANVSMTEGREQLADLAGPYQVVPQAVMVPRELARELDSITDLQGVKVCATTGSTSQAALKGKGIEPILRNTNKQCMNGLKDGVYQAFSTDLTILAGFLVGNEEDFEILDLAIADTSERIGVAVPNGDQAMRKLIAYFLDRWRRKPEEANPWLLAYDRWLRDPLETRYRSQPRVEDVPELADYDSKAPQK